ncbi:ArsR/SmtB family transcription factor [Desulfosporosinus metallidurans]|uniref:Transcriptional regulator, ArsR family n=1 Tax=Desulfosporosinus metallidurans TaxID=1888891 RepID=A0A1Q8R088_9FIRM|nr:metalloregulator ArsR/SmtB family transcription factor [Desulfosporosinus metallidurans]OLN33033.1 Transcriptional regulator, ArsR family [Desulfosporosinus metallidurans]
MKIVMLNKTSNLFKAIAHPSRVQILEYLSSGERCVCEIISELGLGQSNVSQHLAVLRRENLIESRKQGLQVMYRVKHLEILAVLQKSQELISNALNYKHRLMQEIETKE